MVSSKVVWRQGMAFDGALGGATIPIDAHAEFGGVGYGPPPKGLLLTSLVGCTGMDVVAILNKMRVTLDTFEVDAEGELVDAHPKRFDHITLRYRFEGDALPLKKLERAVDLSENRYCGVRASLHPDIAVNTEIFVNGELVTTRAAA